ncbi:MAG: DUF349 domain-containing protein [Alistipes sp.]|jgi:hypothetical protein|nr:DUF349 domain-containing protein [Alistipes sp.]
MSTAKNSAPEGPIDVKVDDQEATVEVAQVVDAQQPEVKPKTKAAPKKAAPKAKAVTNDEAGDEPAPKVKATAKKTAPKAKAVESPEVEVEAEVETEAEIETVAAPEVEETPKVEAPAEEAPTEAVEDVAETVDFSDEEIALAAENLDLGDDESTGETGEAEEGSSDLDLTTKNKSQLVELFADLLATKPIQTLRRDAEAIKVAFYKLHRADLEAARKAFVEAGGEAEAFTAPVDVAETRLKELIGEYRRKRDEFLATLESHREENLKTKLEIIEELKALVGAGETLGHTFNIFRELQQKWREVGPVPQTAVKDLWETYNHHVENFYSFIKINKELRDLDLRKNYEAKVALCEEAEALVLEPSIVVAFHRLQKLHDQWREVGPVAAEHKESVWERFREASGRINRQHQSYFDGIKEEQKKNLDLKSELCEQIEALSREPFTSRREWNKASDKLLEIQKVWKTIGFAPKKNNTRVYERFRAACDAFFEAKRGFYNQLKGEMDLNLALKNEICEAAEALAASDDWKATSDALIGLQRKWKDIGPVPRRHSDAVWKRFRAACDTFFERKNSHFSGVEGSYKENLEKKRSLLAAAEARGTEGLTFEDIKEFQRQWGEVGFVPIKQKEAVAKQYKEVVDRMFSAIRGGEQQRSMEKFRGRVASLKGAGAGASGRLRHERERLYNKVRQLESDIATLENNIGFFGHSKNAEAMIADVREKIDRAKAEMAATIEKINMIDSENE